MLSLFPRLFLLGLLTTLGSAAQAQPSGQPLTAKEIRTFVSGKTLRETVHGQVIRMVYYAADGRAYLVQPRRKGFTQPSASRWEVEDGHLCRPDFPLNRPCHPMSRLSDGTVSLDYGSDNGRTMVRAVDGDPEHLAAFVGKYITDTPTREAAEAEERRGTVPTGTYLTGDEIRALVGGKTIRELPAQRIGAPDPPTFLYLAADGTGYLAANHGQTTWRGPWVIDGRQLCLQGAYWPCSDFRRTADGRIMKEYGGPKGSRTVELFDGDPEGVVQIVANTPPYNQPVGAPPNARP